MSPKIKSDKLQFAEEIESLCVLNKFYVACGLITGQIQWADIETGTVESPAKVSRAPLRSLCTDGELLVAGTSRGLIKCIDLHQNRLAMKLRRKGSDFESGIDCLKMFNHRYLAAGDSAGCISVWDLRNPKKPTGSFYQECNDFISDMDVDERKHILLATSGEGTLTAIKYKRNKVDLQSELFTSEFLTVKYMKGGSKAVCGTGDGVLYLFNEGEWGNMSDRFPVCEVSLDSMVPVDSDHLLIGCEDGRLRLVSILPNRVKGIVGPDLVTPIQCLQMAGNVIVAASHDSFAHLLKVKDLYKKKETKSFFDDLG